MAPKTRGNFPLIKACRADAAGVERVPDVPAFTRPAAFLTRRPLTFRTAYERFLGSAAGGLARFDYRLCLAHRRARTGAPETLRSLKFRQSGQSAAGFDPRKQFQIIVWNGVEMNCGVAAEPFPGSIEDAAKHAGR